MRKAQRYKTPHNSPLGRRIDYFYGDLHCYLSSALRTLLHGLCWFASCGSVTIFEPPRGFGFDPLTAFNGYQCPKVKHDKPQIPKGPAEEYQLKQSFSSHVMAFFGVLAKMRGPWITKPIDLSIFEALGRLAALI